MSGETKGKTKSSSTVAAPAVVIPQLTQQQRRALARGRTIGRFGQNVQPNPFTLRQRAVYEDERLSDAGWALNKARTQGVLRGIQEVGEQRVAAAPVIRAIGRQNLAHRLDPRIAGATELNMQGTRHTPPGVTRHIMSSVEERIPISDLTKTGMFGIPSKREGKKRKDPRAGGKRKKTRKGRRKKTKKRRKKKKFRKGSKSKTHRGKDFETRKSSKNYTSKRLKRITGRRTRRAPLFPFV